MKYDTPQLELWLAKEGGALLGMLRRPQTVSLAPNHTTLTAHMVFENGSRKVALKKLSPSTESPENAAAHAASLVDIHRRVTHESELLARSTPEFYAYHGATRCLAMEFVSGQTLLDILRLALRGRLPGEYDCEALLGQAAAVLAEFHRQKPVAVGLAPADRSNGSFAEGFERMVSDSVLQRPLKGVKPHLSRSVHELSRAFMFRTGNRVLVPDAQPKNVLVPAPDRVCFIDIEYGAGPPAMNVAAFAAAFDRLDMRCWSSRARATVARWKAVFLREYFRNAECAETAGDFPFFYLFVLVRMMQMHLKKRGLLGHYISRRYARQIKLALKNFHATQAPSP